MLLTLEQKLFLVLMQLLELLELVLFVIRIPPSFNHHLRHLLHLMLSIIINFVVFLRGGSGCIPLVSVQDDAATTLEFLLLLINASASKLDIIIIIIVNYLISVIRCNTFQRAIKQGLGLTKQEETVIFIHHERAIGVETLLDGTLRQ